MSLQPRYLLSQVRQDLARKMVFAAGPRQVGKTTLALALADTRPSLYLDLESAADHAKLADPELYLTDHEDKLVILDEVHRLPNLFQPLRGLIDRGRRRGKFSNVCYRRRRKNFSVAAVYDRRQYDIVRSSAVIDRRYRMRNSALISLRWKV